MGKSVVYNSTLTVLRQVIGIVIGMFSAMIIARILVLMGRKICFDYSFAKYVLYII